MNQLKLCSCGEHIAEKVHASSLPPQRGHTHMHIDVYTYVHTHTATGNFQLMVVPQQNFSVLGFSSPIFLSPPPSLPPSLEAGLCQRAEEASELVEGSPQQHGTESCPQRSRHAWLLVLAQVKQYEDFPHSPISCDFELPFLPGRPIPLASACCCELDFLFSLHQARDAQSQFIYTFQVTSQPYPKVWLAATYCCDSGLLVTASCE